MPATTVVEHRALAEFRYEIRRFLRVSEEAARASGLEPQQHQLLLAVKGAPPGAEPTIAWLAERLQLKHHSVVGLVDRLEHNGLVERERNAEDLRQVLVRVTPAGAALLHDLSLLHQDEIRLRAPALVAAMMAIMRTRTPRR